MTNYDLPLVLYGAGRNAKKGLENVKKSNFATSHAVMCFCDKDKNKQGTLCLGLPVFNLEQVREKYGNYFNLYITTDTPIRYEIQEELVGVGVDKDRILNYEKVSKYRSCAFLQEQLILFSHGMQVCCNFNINGNPFVIPWDKDGNLEKNVSDFIEKRDQTIENIKKGVPTACDGCEFICENYWKADNRITSLSFSFLVSCHLTCIYCPCVQEKPSVQQREFARQFDFKKVLNVLEKQNRLSDRAVIGFSGGEITIQPRKDEWLEASKNYTVNALTTAIKYDQKLSEAVGTKDGYILISVDAGTRKTYKKVKGLDAFDAVWDNINQYVNSGVTVQLKYIVLPENSDDENIDEFINRAAVAGVDLVFISFDFFAKYQLTDEMTNQIVKMRMNAEKMGLNSQWAFGTEQYPDKINKLNELYNRMKENEKTY